MENKVENWKFGYINKNRIYVFNSPRCFQILGGHFLEGVELIFLGESTIRIKAKEIIYGFYIDPIEESKWSKLGIEPESEDIMVKKRFGFFGRPIKYVQGWVKKSAKNYDVVFTGQWSLSRNED